MGDAALEQFCILAKSAKGHAAVQIIAEATSAPNLFAFGELLDQPNLQELKGTEHAASYELLRMFAHGTWSDYKAAAGMLPALNAEQQLKLKQLTVVSLAENAKVLPYSLLMEQLEVTNVRQLEDLLINDCMYTGIIQGKLDQQQRCLEVHYAIGRDIRPGQLKNMISALSEWAKTSDELLKGIKEKVAWSSSMTEEKATHRAELEAKIEEIKNAIKPEADRGHHEGIYSEGGISGMDYYPMEEDRAGRTKRRR
uniref:PCI domain-containing protein n=1 Tax=Pyramimonas obovata TaxID=1411642 RepID=A0A7S0WJU6_9CHLO|mmetsp:Transcript_27809/g.60843  ORF Transcript_27809/g.60843 Transcript_27809/m.60843 type:complete len:254 (+) Transcript_27809:201-962(+)|eukprot:CAMPEP_0118935310 /NCGR_PEP_ID=MMETSP1169-20130426/15390_1 /TAXON_ID=36882 /ORGANISM="Pyramimonas obovata, Strain CCMP722" /LENGTH=253 /DNA_ID=CAMNT_0006878327 /DNA_START=199 /DNA_END=960 /DNA_ORIENTATION=+